MERDCILCHVTTAGDGDSDQRQDIRRIARFLSCFVVDARGCELRGSRCLPHVRVSVPPNAVAMPTRITCRMVKPDKLPNVPSLEEGDEYVSRVLQLDPVGITFNRTLCVQIPHVSSLERDAPWRSVELLRSNDGINWIQQTRQSTVVAIDSANFRGDRNPFPVPDKSSIVIATRDFPRYFVAVSSVRRHSARIGSGGGQLVPSADPRVRVDVPPGSVTHDTKIALKVFVVTPAELKRLPTARDLLVGTGFVLSLEPVRRRFFRDVTLTLPLPQTADGEFVTSGLRLFTCVGVDWLHHWVDITHLTTIDVGNNSLRFCTNVTAKFLLIGTKCHVGVDEGLLSLATREVYDEAVSTPLSGRFVVFVQRRPSHLTDTVRLSVLCVSDDIDLRLTADRHHSLCQIVSGDTLQMRNGTSYVVNLTGNLYPSASSDAQRLISFRAFHVSRLSVVGRLRCVDRSPDVASIAFLRASVCVADGSTIVRCCHEPVCVLDLPSRY